MSKKIENKSVKSEEVFSERLYIRVTKDVKEALLKRVTADRKQGESLYGAISKFIREAIYSQITRK
jgi:predicted HicB family RNase H-like nuclease